MELLESISLSRFNQAGMYNNQNKLVLVSVEEGIFSYFIEAFDEKTKNNSLKPFSPDIGVLTSNTWLPICPKS